MFLGPLLELFKNPEPSVCMKRLVDQEASAGNAACARNSPGYTEMYHGLCYIPCDVNKLPTGFPADVKTKIVANQLEAETGTFIGLHTCSGSTCAKDSKAYITRDRTAANVITTTAQSGRYYGGRDATCWELIDPAKITPGTSWKDASNNEIAPPAACSGFTPRCNGRTRISWWRGVGEIPKADASWSISAVSWSSPFGFFCPDSSKTPSFGHCYDRCPAKCTKDYVWARGTRLGPSCVGNYVCPAKFSVRCGIYCTKSSASCFVKTFSIVLAAISSALKITALVMTGGGSFVADLGKNVITAGVVVTVKFILSKLIDKMKEAFGSKASDANIRIAVLDQLVKQCVAQGGSIANGAVTGNHFFKPAIASGDGARPASNVGTGGANNGPCTDMTCACKFLFNNKFGAILNIPAPAETKTWGQMGTTVATTMVAQTWEVIKSVDATGLGNLLQTIYEPFCEDPSEVFTQTANGVTTCGGKTLATFEAEEGTLDAYAIELDKKLPPKFRAAMPKYSLRFFKETPSQWNKANLDATLARILALPKWK